MHVTVTGMFDIHRLRFSALVVLVVLGVLWFLSWVSPQGATLVDKTLKIQDGSVMRTSLHRIQLRSNCAERKFLDKSGNYFQDYLKRPSELFSFPKIIFRIFEIILILFRHFKYLANVMTLDLANVVVQAIFQVSHPKIAQ